MRELRLLRQDADSATLVFTTHDTDDQFVLRVDDMIRSAVHFDVAHAKVRTPVPAPAPAAPPSPVSPREIQVRVRAGEAPEAIAEEYGVELGKILRFAAPVVEERGRIRTEARRSRARGGVGDGRPVVFGDFIDKRFASAGVTPTGVEWDARRREDGEWVVVATWRRDDEPESAAWIFHRTTRTVTPADEFAAELLSDRPMRPTPAPRVDPGLAPGVVPFPPMADALTTPLRDQDEVFDQEDVRDEPRTGPTFERLPEPPLPVPPVPMPATATGDVGDGFGTPSLPLTLSEPSRSRKGGERRREGGSRQARTKIPSWDDIVIGVRPRND